MRRKQAKTELELIQQRQCDDAAAMFYMENPDIFAARYQSEFPYRTINPEFKKSRNTPPRKCLTTRCLLKVGLISCLLLLVLNMWLSVFVTDIGSVHLKPIYTPNSEEVLNYFKNFQKQLGNLTEHQQIKRFPLLEDQEASLALYGASAQIYSQFSLSTPVFPNSNPLFIDLFWKNELNRKAILYPDEVSRRGIIAVIPNGVLSTNTHCNSEFSPQQFLADPPGDKALYHQYLLPLNDVSTKCRISNLITEFLPRLAQAKDFLQLPNLTIIIYGDCDNMAKQIIQSGLNLNVAFYPKENVHSYTAKFLINSCAVPKLHPSLVRIARDILSSHSDLNPSKRYSRVALLLRLAPALRRRTLSNLGAVQSILEDRFAEVTIFEGAKKFEEIRNLFEKSKIFIAVHGPVLYNIIFAPPKSQIVEIFATRSDGSYITDYGQDKVNDIWRLALSLGHRYYRMLEKPDGNLGAVRVNPENFEYMVDTLLSEDDI